MSEVYIALSVHALMSLIALVFIWRSSEATKRKGLQSLFALLVPFAGPLFTLIVHISDRRIDEKLSDRYYGQSIDEAPLGIQLPIHHDDV